MITDQSLYSLKLSNYILQCNINIYDISDVSKPLYFIFTIHFYAERVLLLVSGAEW